MPTIIEQLCNEHRFIIDTLDEVYRLGISTPSARESLRKVKTVLLQHLEREDAELYPVLDEKAAVNATLANLLQTMRSEMDEVSKTALAFFERYDDGGEGFEFARDFGKLRTQMQSRIRREESRLYPHFT